MKLLPSKSTYFFFLIMLGISFNLHAGLISTFSNLSDFEMATTTTSQQDFESFNNGDNLLNIDVLNGVSVSTNTNELIAFVNANMNTSLFALGRNSVSTVTYSIFMPSDIFAFAMDIGGFEAGGGPANADPNSPGVLTVNFADSSSEQIELFGNLLGEDIFVGLLSDVAISSITWLEAPEVGSMFSEETSLDNFKLASQLTRDVSTPISIFYFIVLLLALKPSRKQYR